MMEQSENLKNRIRKLLADGWSPASYVSTRRVLSVISSEEERFRVDFCIICQNRKKLRDKFFDMYASKGYDVIIERVLNKDKIDPIRLGVYIKKLKS